MTQRLILLVTLMLILSATAVLVYTYPEERTLSMEFPQKNAKLTEWKGKALQLYSEEKYVHCELVLQRILRTEPGDLDALHLLTLLRHKAGNFEDEERICRQILHRTPEDAAAHNNLGVLLFSRNEFKDGFREISVAAVLLPKEPVIRYNLQCAQVKIGMPGATALPPKPAETFPLLTMEAGQ